MVYYLLVSVAVFYYRSDWSWVLVAFSEVISSIGSWVGYEEVSRVRVLFCC